MVLPGIFLDSAHVSIYKATTVMRDDVFRCLVSDLVIKIYKSALGLGFYLFLCSHQPTVMFGTVLCLVELVLKSPN